MKQCSQCGQKYDDVTRFCPMCGATLLPVPEGLKLEDAPAEEASEPVAEEHREEAERDPVPVPSESEEENLPRKAEQDVPKKKPRETAARLGFGRRLLGFVLCLALLLFLFAAAAIYDIRDNSSEAGMEAMLDSVRVASVPASELIAGAGEDQRVSEWLTDRMEEALGERMTAGSRDMETFLEESTLKERLAERLAAIARDIYAGKTGERVTGGDVSDLLRENADLLAEEFGLNLDRGQRELIEDAVESTGVLDALSSKAIRENAPAVYFALFLGCSWVSLGVLGVLALLCFVALARSQKSLRRALSGTGIVLILLGVLRLLPVLPALVFPSLWQKLCFGNYLISVLIGRLLVSHALIPSLAALGLGILLTVICGLVRRARKRRADEIAEK